MGFQYPEEAWKGGWGVDSTHEHPLQPACELGTLSFLFHNIPVKSVLLSQA